MNAPDTRHTPDLAEQLSRAKATIAESEARYRYIVETTNEGVWLIDAAHKTTFMNRRMAQMLGCEADMGAGRSPIEFLDEAGRANFRAHLDHPGDVQMEVQFIRLDGTSLWALLAATPMIDATGRYNGSLAMVKDVTERKQAAEAAEDLSRRAAQRERLLTTTLASISDFTYTCDRVGRFLYINRPLLDWWGVALDDAVGRSFIDLGYPAASADWLQRQVQEVFETRQSLSGETRYLSPAGVTGYHEYILSPAVGADDDVEFVVGSTRDISARKAAEAELRRARDAAAAASHAKSDFLVNVSHQIWTPMKDITRMTDLLLDDELTSEQRQRLETIKSSARALMAVVTSVLDFSRK